MSKWKKLVDIQKDATNRGKSFFYLGRDEGRKMYKARAFEKINHLYEFYTNHITPVEKSEHGYYEMLFQTHDTPARLFLDFDHKVQDKNDFNKETFNLICEQVLKTINQELNFQTKSYTVTDGSREIDEDKFKYKYSFHMIFTHLYMKHEHMKNLVVKINEDLKDSFESNIKFDEKIYNKNRFFRLPYSGKHGSEAVLRPINEEKYKTSPLDFFACVPPTTQSIIKYGQAKKRKLKPDHSNRSTRRRLDNNVDDDIDVDDGALFDDDVEENMKKVYNFIKKYPDETFNHILATVKRFDSHAEIRRKKFDRYDITNKPRHCLFDKRHDRNNAFVTINERGDLFYYCHATSCPPCQKCNKKNGTKLGSVYNFLDITIPSSVSELVGNVVEYKEDFCRQPNLGIRSCCFALRASCGSGKSYSVFEFLKTRRSQFPNLKILFITTRLSLKRQLESQIKEKKLNQNATCIQYESLHTLDRELLKNINILVLDELESLLQNVYSITNGRNQTNNSSTFNALMRQQSKKGQIIAMDADLNQCGLKFLNHFYPKERITLHHNQKQVTPRIYQENTHDEWFSKLDNALKDEQKIMVVTNGLTIAKMVAALAEENELKQGEDYQLYTSESKEEKEDLEDVDKYWSKYKLVVFSPTVSVGIDFSVKDHFGQVFCYVVPQSCVARTVMQMVARCRYPNSKTIILTYLLKSMMKSYYSHLKAVTQKFCPSFSFCEKGFEEGDFIIKEEEWYFDVIVHKVSETYRSRAFNRQIMQQLCEQKSHRYTMTEKARKKLYCKCKPEQETELDSDEEPSVDVRALKASVAHNDVVNFNNINTPWISTNQNGTFVIDWAEVNHIMEMSDVEGKMTPEEREIKKKCSFHQKFKSYLIDDQNVLRSRETREAIIINDHEFLVDGDLYKSLKYKNQKIYNIKKWLSNLDDPSDVLLKEAKRLFPPSPVHEIKLEDIKNTKKILTMITTKSTTDENVKTAQVRLMGEKLNFDAMILINLISKGLGLKSPLDTDKEILKNDIKTYFTSEYYNTNLKEPVEICLQRETPPPDEKPARFKPFASNLFKSHIGYAFSDGFGKKQQKHRLKPKDDEIKIDDDRKYSCLCLAKLWME
eukprot:m.6011 g.6011  ORF g.6011 m.6011 type:complete len:1107 (-) comp5788_c0_seq1:58-3378(-)